MFKQTITFCSISGQCIIAFDAVGTVYITSVLIDFNICGIMCMHKLCIVIDSSYKKNVSQMAVKIYASL